MTVDHDGKIRMDCSSPYAMAGLVKLKDRFDVAFGNDPDSDRHGIVTRSSGLMNPNHYLAVAIRYLLTPPPRLARRRGGRQDAGQQRHHRPGRAGAGPDARRGAGRLQVVRAGSFRRLLLLRRRGERGASFLRRDGTAWTTDKDGLILGLLAAEITAKTGKDPGEHYREITAEYGAPLYTRIDSPATPAQKALLQNLSPDVGQGDGAGRRADRRQADPRPGKRGRDRWPQDRRPERLVRGTALGDGGHLQALRRELPGPGPSGRHHCRGPADRERRPGRRPGRACPEIHGRTRHPGIREDPT